MLSAYRSGLDAPVIRAQTLLLSAASNVKSLRQFLQIVASGDVPQHFDFALDEVTARLDLLMFLEAYG